MLFISVRIVYNLMMEETEPFIGQKKGKCRENLLNEFQTGEEMSQSFWL